MSTISNLLTKHSNLDLEQIDWLQMLVGDWQVISDLVFADLVLWAPVEDGQFMAVAQCRPSLAPRFTTTTSWAPFADEPQRPDRLQPCTVREPLTGPTSRWYGSFAVRGRRFQLFATASPWQFWHDKPTWVAPARPPGWN